MDGDYYKILGLTKNASNDDVRRAYYKLALKYHPDKNKSRDAEEIFKRINEAHEVLADEAMREEYDAYCEEVLKEEMTANNDPIVRQSDLYTYAFLLDPRTTFTHIFKLINPIQMICNMFASVAATKTVVHYELNVDMLEMHRLLLWGGGFGAG